MYGILPRQLFFVAAVVYSGSWDFLYGRCKQFLLANSLMLISPDIYILKQCLSGKVLHNSLLHLLLKHHDFLNIYISQGSVATCFGCGEVIKYDFVTNFLLSLKVKEF